jgi:hypothetical protein
VLDELGGENDIEAISGRARQNLKIRHSVKVAEFPPCLVHRLLGYVDARALVAGPS